MYVSFLLAFTVGGEGGFLRVLQVGISLLDICVFLCGPVNSLFFFFFLRMNPIRTLRMFLQYLYIELVPFILKKVLLAYNFSLFQVF